MKPSTHRPTRAIISLTAIQDNIKQFKTHVGKQTEVWAVVKANAYGHGAISVSQSIDDLVAGFCVSNLDEAIELRSHGTVKPILVLSGIVPEDIHIAVNLRLIVTVPSLDWFKLVSQHLEDVDCGHLRFHIKVDSGMGRIGVTTAEEANQIIALADELGADFAGVFTHFATADEVAQEKLLTKKKNLRRLSLT